MFKEPIRIFAIATVGGPTRRLNIGDAVWLRSQNPEKCLRMHGARADLNIVRLLNHAASIAPILLQLKDEILKRRPLLNLIL